MTASDPTSASTLLAHARRFDAMVARFHRPLIQYFRKRDVALSDAEDMAQDVFLKLLRKMRSDTGEISAGYVFSAASSVMIDHHRRATSQPTTKCVEIDPEHGANEPSPESIFADREALRVMLDELPAMRDIWRKAFILSRFEQLSHNEVARRLKISVSLAEKSVAHAVAHLRQKLGRDRDD